MSRISGTKGKITVNASTSEAVVMEIGSFSIDISHNANTTNSFDSEWDQTDPGGLSYSGSFSGQYMPGDTTGQKVLEDAMLARTKLADIRFYEEYSATTGEDLIYHAPDTASESTAGLYITAFNVSQDRSGVATVSGSFTGSGPILKTESTVPA